MPKEIIFTIRKDGTVRIEAEGFVGGECKDATEAFRKALGGVTLSDKDKPEIYLSYLPGAVENRNG